MPLPVFLRPQRRVYARRREIGFYPYNGQAAAAVGGIYGPAPLPTGGPQSAVGQDFLSALLEAFSRYAFSSQLAGQNSFLYSGIAGANLNDRTVPVKDSNQQICSYRSGRRYFFVLNIGSEDAFVTFGRVAKTNQGVLLQANQYYEPNVPTYGEVNAISTATGTNLTVIEG